MDTIEVAADGTVKTPPRPVIPFIEGDGTGRDIWRASVRVFDAGRGDDRNAAPQLVVQRNQGERAACGARRRRLDDRDARRRR